MIEEVCDTYYEAINWAIMEIRAFQRATGPAADRLLARASEQTAGVQGWLGRIADRPAVVATFEAAAASMQGFEMLPGLVASGHFKREYRDHRLEWMLRSGGADIVLEAMRNDNIRFTREFS